MAEAPAQAQSDWSIAGPIRFVAKIEFQVANQIQAMVVLEKATTGENKMIKTVRMPVVLVPGN